MYGIQLHKIVTHNITILSAFFSFTPMNSLNDIFAYELQWEEPANYLEPTAVALVCGLAV